MPRNPRKIAGFVFLAIDLHGCFEVGSELCMDLERAEVSEYADKRTGRLRLTEAKEPTTLHNTGWPASFPSRRARLLHERTSLH